MEEKINELWEHNYYSMSIRELESYAKKAWLQDFYKGCLTSEDVENKVKVKLGPFYTIEEAQEAAEEYENSNK